jgi:hypothetical protein
MEQEIERRERELRAFNDRGGSSANTRQEGDGEGQRRADSSDDGTRQEGVGQDINSNHHSDSPDETRQEGEGEDTGSNHRSDSSEEGGSQATNSTFKTSSQGASTDSDFPLKRSSSRNQTIYYVLMYYHPRTLNPNFCSTFELDSRPHTPNLPSSLRGNPISIFSSKDAALRRLDYQKQKIEKGWTVADHPEIELELGEKSPIACVTMKDGVFLRIWWVEEAIFRGEKLH